MTAGELRTRALLVELRAVVRSVDALVTAWSGGVDSSLLAYVAHTELGPRALAVTAVSPSLARRTLAEMSTFAAGVSMAWRTVRTAELDSPAYRRNGPDRCYHCKSELFSALGPIAGEMGAEVATGTIVDDLDDFRPGLAAGREHRVLTPLADCGFSKADVRAAAAALSLPMWDKPAAPCLASRVPHGVPVTIETLGRVERAEASLAALGFDDLRVRHYGQCARIELPDNRLVDAVAARAAIVAGVKAAGYRYVTVDLEGLRPGNLAPDPKSTIEAS